MFIITYMSNIHSNLHNKILKNFSMFKKCLTSEHYMREKNFPTLFATKKKTFLNFAKYTQTTNML